MGTPAPSLISVNVTELRELTVLDGRTVKTGLFKQPAAGPVMVRRDGLEGDSIGDRRAHGSPDQAVYAYAREDQEWWAGELGRELDEGFFGQNLTTAGVATSAAVVGERWRIGGAMLEVAGPRLPCFKLAARVGDRGFEKRFGAARRPGAYLRVIEEGPVEAGDAVLVAHRPEHGVTVTEVSRAALGEKRLRGRALEAPALHRDLRARFERSR